MDILSRSPFALINTSLVPFHIALLLLLDIAMRSLIDQHLKHITLNRERVGSSW